MTNKKEAFNLNNVRLFDALPGAGAIVGQDGEILWANKKWKKGAEKFHWLGIDSQSDNYFSHCEEAVSAGNDYALKIIFGLREVLDGSRDTFEITSPLESSKKNWFKVTITPVDESNGKVLVFFEDVSKNMQAMRSLRESEERYSQHFINSMSGILLSSPNGSILDVNPAACSILGYTKKELIEGGISLIIDGGHPLNRDAEEIRKEQSVFEGEKELIHKDGTRILVEVSSVIYRNEDGEHRCIDTFRDKSGEKKTLQSLEEERRFTKAAINSLPGLFFLMDSDMNLVRWNEAYKHDLGYSDEEISNRIALDFITEEDRDRTVSVISDVFQSGSGHLITRLYRKDGIKRYYHLYGSRFMSNGQSYLVGTGTDITDLIEAEQEKDKNYELISQLFESSPLGMVMISPQKKALKVNDSFCDLFGFHKLDIIGADIDELILLEDQYSEADQINQAVLSGKGTKQEVVRYRKDGSPLSLIVNTIPIWQNREIVGAYAIYVDLTEQKKLEADLQQSLAEKEILLQEIHHRVKNNLAVITGLLDLQIMEENDSLIEVKLNQIRSRIFSIAKIHETLYANEDVVQIRFDQYLENLAEALPQAGISETEEVTVELNADAVTLNLNQAVPCGLAVNELLSSLITDGNGPSHLTIDLKENDEEVELTISGNTLPLDGIEEDDGSFHKMLIDIFLAQISGKLKTGSDSHSAVSIVFKRKDLRGSSSSIRHSHELNGS